MSTDQELRARLAEIISNQSDALDIAEGILDYPELLDGICEYRARQIDAQRDIEPGLADTVDRMVRLSGRGVSLGELLTAREAAASIALDRDETYAVGGSDE